MFQQNLTDVLLILGMSFFWQNIEEYQNQYYIQHYCQCALIIINKYYTTGLHTMGKKTQKPAKQIEPDSEQPQSPQLMIDYEGIHASQKKLETLCMNAQKTNTIQYYSKVKYKQNIYQVGEFVQLYDPTDTVPYVCKIQSIIRIPNSQPQIPAILKVQWLLRKNDLPQKYDKYLKHLSIAEVFPSTQVNYVRIESILRKCFVLQNCEYEYLQNAGQNIHYARAIFNMETGELEPHPKQWQKSCYCAMPVNPDLAYVLCERCEKWFHNQCVKDKQMLEQSAFLCLGCKGQGQGQGQSKKK